MFCSLEWNYFSGSLGLILFECLLEPQCCWRTDGEGFSPVLPVAALEERAALCQLLFLAPASWNCSLAVQWQQIICVMDFLFGMCENSAFGLIDRTELKHLCYSNGISKVDSEHGYESS